MGADPMRFLPSPLNIKVKKLNETQVYVFLTWFIHTSSVVSSWFIRETSVKISLFQCILTDEELLP